MSKPRGFVAGLLLLTLVPLARPQSLTITTLAGAASQGNADGIGAAARFANPWGVAVDATGNVYVADTDNHIIRKISAGGAVSTFAGMPGVAGSANGTGSNARFNQPQGIAVDNAGNLYVADTGNHTIRLITPEGVVSTLAGSAGNSGSTDASGSSARFYEPEGIVVNGPGTLIYVADTWNHTIRQITDAGVVSTLAGSAGNFGSTEGNGSNARFYQPQGVALDAGGSLYVGDTGNQLIRKVTAAGTVSTLAGSAGSYGSTDGNGSSARFYAPQGIAVDAATNVYVADSFNYTIRKVTPAGVVSTLAGTAGSTGSADGTGPAARFWQPQGVAVDSTGNVYVADTGNGTIREIAGGAVVSTFAGSASSGSADGTGGYARFNSPSGAAIDNAGNSYVADTANATIRMITSNGVVTTLAGSAGSVGSADATGSDARFSAPQAVAVAGNVYVADTANHTIRKITPAGVVTTLAGLAGTAGIANGTGSSARFNSPQGLAADSSGTLFVADTGSRTIRKVTSAGVVTTLAGVPGSYGDTDGTSPSVGTNSARFNSPSGIAVDSLGNVYVADTGNHTIRKVTAAGVVSTLAGVAGVWGSADGTNSAALFNRPEGVTVDSSGNLYVLDSGNHTIRALAPVGTNWVVTTVAGFPAVGGSADGSGNSARFLYPSGIGLNSAGSLCVADLGNNTIRANFVSTNTAPAIDVPPQDQTVDQGQDASFSVAATGAEPLTYQWLFKGDPVSTATASTYTRTNAQPADEGDYSVIVYDSAGSVTSAPALLTVIPASTAPDVTTQPHDLTVNQTSDASFTVTGYGSRPLYYQWLHYGTNLPGGTDSTYTCTNAQASSAGPYSVVITNNYGSDTSLTATLTVILPPIISVQPASQLASVSNSVSFQVGLSQGTSPAYQWRRNGAPIGNATRSSLTLSPLSWTDAGTYSVVVSNSAGSQTSADATLTIQQAAVSFFDGFEGYLTGSVDKNTSGGPNTGAANPWWALSTSAAHGWVTNAGSGVSPHGGSQMLGALSTATLRQDYLNLLYRLNSGQPYYGNFMCDWWFYDPYGTNSGGATNSQDYLAVCQYAPVSTTADASASFTAYNQRMSLGTFNAAGYSYSNYQARIVGATGGFNANGWFNTATLRSVGWHHARIVVGIPDASSYAPVSMYVDDMLSPTFAYPTSGVNVGFNLIELNHAMSKAGYFGYYDDLTFRAANDPWIVEQPVSQTVDLSQPASFTTVAVGTAYQWQLNGTNVSSANASTCTIAAATAADAGSYTCVISGANGTVTTATALLTVTGLPAQPGHFDSVSLEGDGSLRLNMSGTPYTNYILESTGDWTNWTDLTNLSAPSGLFQFNDPVAANSAVRLYRLRVAP